MRRRNHCFSGQEDFAYTIKRFEHKVVAVTGGAKGIGKGCCLRFAAEGARVAVLDLAMEDAAAVAAECEMLNGQPALALCCNVADAAGVGLDPSADACVPAEDPAIRQAGADLRRSLHLGADSRFQLFDGTLFTWQEQETVLLIEGSPVLCANHLRAFWDAGAPCARPWAQMASRSPGRHKISLAERRTRTTPSAGEPIEFSGNGKTESAFVVCPEAPGVPVWRLQPVTLGPAL